MPALVLPQVKPPPESGPKVIRHTPSTLAVAGSVVGPQPARASVVNISMRRERDRQSIGHLGRKVCPGNVWSGNALQVLKAAPPRARGKFRTSIASNARAGLPPPMSQVKR